MLSPSAFKPRHRNSRKGDAEKRVPAFLKWLRGRPCAVRTSDCEGRIEAAHVDFLGNKGMATKTEDWNAIPLCSAHHHEQHGKGWQTFQSDHRLDAGRDADAYWRAWLRTPMGAAWSEGRHV